MDTGVLLQILLMLFLVVCSAFFSATETAFSSLNRTRLKSLAEHGNVRAEKALRLAEKYDELLSTILIGNNIVNIALASIGTVLFVRWVGSAGVTVSTIVITVVVLIFGEISPKSMAKEMPEAFAMKAAPIIGGLVKLLKPLNFLFTQWKKFLSRMFKVKQEHKLTQDELLTLVEEVEQEGGMNAEESDLLRSAIEFHDQEVGDILTPRVQVEGVALDDPPETIAKVFDESGYSRLPVYEGTIDRIVGIIHQKDFYSQLRRGKVSLEEIMKSPVYVTENIKISTLMRLLQKQKSQMAVVVDEYGGTVGILTMEDILEELVGEIWDEHDEIEERFVPVREGVWRVLGTTPVEELSERFNGLGSDAEATTVGGWVMEISERIPRTGEVIDCGDYQVTVLKADGRHVQEIELKRIA